MLDFIFDLETFGSTSNAAVIDLSWIVFDPDPTKVETFQELVARGKRIKFDLASQKGQRLFSTSTLNWWKDQSQEARENIKPSSIDVTVMEGIVTFLESLKEQGINPWESLGYCRGQSFDFPLVTDMIRQRFKYDTGCEDKDIDTFNLEPVKFWQQRDLRTAIENLLLVRGLTMTPLPKGTLDGFIAHDSIHDCAKDILMLQYAKRYAMGLQDAPEGDDIDPLSVKQR
ncbi:exonuclease [Providencia phage PSTRCR_121]|nr:exonuclease [Providencia phage PSTRCR_121]